MLTKRHRLLLLALALILAGLTVPTWLYPYMPRFDSGAYIMGVESLARGELPKVLSHPMQPPATYPPVTMLLLAPMYKLCGGSDVALRAALSLLWLAAMLLMIYAWRDEERRRFLPWLLALSATGTVWLYCGRIQSEIPYLLLTLAAVVCLDRLKNDERFFGGVWGPLALVLTVLVPLTRQIGLMLPAGAALYLAWDRNRLKRGLALGVLFAIIGVLPAIALYVKTQPGQFSPKKSSVMRRDGWDPSKGQVGLLSRETLGRIKMNAVGSATLAPAALFVLDFPPESTAMRAGLVVLFFLMLLGYVLRWIRGPTAAEFYLACYLALLWLTPWLVETRFFTVLVPWLIFYLLTAVDFIARWIWRQDDKAIWAGRVLVIALTVVNLFLLATYDFRDRWSRINNDEAAMYAWGAEQLDPDDVVLTRDPFAFYVLHRHPAMSYTVSEQKYQPRFRLSSYLAGGGRVDAILFSESENTVVTESLAFYDLSMEIAARHPAGWILAEISIQTP